MSWVVAFPVGIMLGWLLAFGTQPSHQTVQKVRTERVLCGATVVRPRHWLCSNRRVYDARWQDIGPVTHIPPVPR